MCYPGQEPDPAGSGGLLWSLTERDSAECSVIRLGGLNARPHGKPHQATVGGDRDVLNLRWATTKLAGNSQDGNYCHLPSNIALKQIMYKPIDSSSVS